MAKAKYLVFIPTGVPQVAMAAHHFLTYGPLATAKATVHPGNPYDTLDVFAEDTPEIDSHMKQLGVFIGEIANTPSTTVTKEGPKATAVWDLRNPSYVPLPPQAAQAPQTPSFSASPLQSGDPNAASATPLQAPGMP